MDDGRDKPSDLVDHCSSPIVVKNKESEDVAVATEDSRTQPEEDVPLVPKKSEKRKHDEKEDQVGDFYGEDFDAISGQKQPQKRRWDYNMGNQPTEDIPDSSCESSTTASSKKTLLSNVLNLFQIQKVLSLNSITRELWDKRILHRVLPTHVDYYVISGVSAPLTELKSVMDDQTENIHGLFVLKSRGEAKPFRDFVINLFRRDPVAKLKKENIINEATIFLKRGISDSEFDQVMSELCFRTKGLWGLKSGDLDCHSYN